MRKSRAEQYWVTTEWGKPELLVKNRTFLVLFWDAPRTCPNAPAPIQAAPLASSSSRRFRFHDMMQVSSGRSIGRGHSASARPRRRQPGIAPRLALAAWLSGSEYPWGLAITLTAECFRGELPRVHADATPPLSLVPHARPERNREGGRSASPEMVGQEQPHDAPARGCM